MGNVVLESGLQVVAAGYVRVTGLRARQSADLVRAEGRGVVAAVRSDVGAVAEQVDPLELVVHRRREGISARIAGQHEMLHHLYDAREY